MNAENSLILNHHNAISKLHYNLRLPERLKKISKVTPAIGIKNYYAVERADEKWNKCNLLARPIIKQVHFATIDAVKTFKCANKRFCLTGARDRNIILWDLDSISKENDNAKWIKKEIAHEGWIWQIDYDGNLKFYSAGWDRFIKQWLIAESHIENTLSLLMDSAVLSCIVDNENMLYCSTFTKGPIQCDTRTNLTVLNTLKCHGSKSIFSMTTSKEINYLYSMGEDNRLISIDKRMFTEPIRVWKAPEKVSKIQYSSGYLGVGCRSGTLMFLNPETLECEDALCVEQKEFVLNDIRNHHFSLTVSRGANYCAYGHFLKVYSPGLSSKLMASYELDAIITQMDYYEDTLVAGSGMGTVYFWQ